MKATNPVHAYATLLSTALWIVALAIAVGCDRPANEYGSAVTGTVTIDGELAKSGTVTFHPVKEGVPAIGRIYPDGSYSLRTGQGDLQESDGGTVVPGEYLVTVSITAPPAEGAVVAEGGPPVPGPSLIAAKYLSKDTTDLQVTVSPGKNVLVLELEATEPATAEEGEETRESDAEESAESASEPASEPESSNEASPPEATPAPSDGAPADASPGGATSDAASGETTSEEVQPESRVEVPAP